LRLSIASRAFTRDFAAAGLAEEGVADEGVADEGVADEGVAVCGLAVDNSPSHRALRNALL
jgi:hypothetical protein